LQKSPDLNEEERLILKQLILKMGRSPSELLSNNDFIIFYAEETDNYQKLSPKEKAVVDKCIKKYISFKEKPFVEQFKENIGFEQSLGDKMKKKQQKE